MPFAYDRNFARVDAVHGETVDLTFDQDPDPWPWLALPATHPVVIEKIQYFAALTGFWALGRFVPEDNTALLGIGWEVERLDAGPIVAGTFRSRDAFFDITVRDPAGHTVGTIRGAGVALTGRDVPAWRAASRAKALATAQECPRPSLDPGRFVGRPRPTPSGLMLQGLVGSDTGFVPVHPYHTGSGDHVNVGHLADITLQAAEALEFRDPRSGEGQFQRFVELDVPFEVRVTGDASAVEVTFTQLDRACATFAMRR